MTTEEIQKRLSGLASSLNTEIGWQAEDKGDPFATVPAGKWREVCQAARDRDEMGFNFLRSLCGVDYPDDKQIEVVAHLFSYKHRHALVLKTRVDREAPELDTVCGVWPAAVWHERETFDLLGVRFKGNPDLRRIMLPDDWVGHPLRKDYKEPEQYNGIPTSRPGYPEEETT